MFTTQRGIVTVGVQSCVYLVELRVGDSGNWVGGFGLTTDHLGREVRQGHHSKDVTVE